MALLQRADLSGGTAFTQRSSLAGRRPARAALDYAARRGFFVVFLDALARFVDVRFALAVFRAVLRLAVAFFPFVAVSPDAGMIFFFKAVDAREIADEVRPAKPPIFTASFVRPVSFFFIATSSIEFERASAPDFQRRRRTTQQTPCRPDQPASTTGSALPRRAL